MNTPKPLEEYNDRTIHNITTMSDLQSIRREIEKAEDKKKDFEKELEKAKREVSDLEGKIREVENEIAQMRHKEIDTEQAEKDADKK